MRSGGVAWTHAELARWWNAELARDSERPPWKTDELELGWRQVSAEPSPTAVWPARSVRFETIYRRRDARRHGKSAHEHAIQNVAG